jgi:HlyD family secretion protein
MNSKILRYAAFVAVVSGAAAAWFVLRPQADDGGLIRLSGNIEITDAHVGFRIAGRVEERWVSEGHRVMAGQRIARLDAEELEREAALRQAEVAGARAALAELLAGNRPEEVRQAEAALRRVTADLERIQADRERKEFLFENDVISAMELDAVRSAHEAAEARMRESTEQLEVIRSGPRRETVEQARARLDHAEQALALARTRLGYTVLTSPIEGFVLSNNAEPGEYVGPGAPVVTVGNLENIWLRTYIDGARLGLLRLGQTARVTTDSLPGKVYEGRVSFIASEAEFTPKNVQTAKERVKLVYRIKIDIHNPDFELKPGMPADAEIVTGDVEE